MSQPLPAEFQTRVIAVHQGDCVVSAEDVTLSTVLGSCIAACVRDTEAGVGGMNHFLLASPGDAAGDRFGASARYGAFAMEQLINKVLGAGSGNRRSLEVKVFGGGKMNQAMADVGSANIAFLRRFLATEGFRAAAEDLGGGYARRVLFKPASGRVMIKRLDAAAAAADVERAETALVRAPQRPGAPGDIELF